MGCSWRAQQRMPRWLLEADLADLAWELDPRPVPPDPTEIEELIDLPWVA